MTRKVIVETVAADHDASLYEGAVIDQRVDGLAGASESHVARFHENGFLHIANAFDEAAVTAARRELEAMAMADEPACEAICYEGLIRAHIRADSRRHRAGDGRPSALGEQLATLPAVDRALRASHVRKFQGFTDCHPPLAALAELPALRTLVERLVGGPTRLFQDMALVKPPGGREKPWHQDHAYFNFPLATPIVGAWIPLHDVDPDNGCMHLLPGAHKKGPQRHVSQAARA